VIPFTVVCDEIEIAVVFDRPKVATLFGPFGTLSGVQFAGVFQSPEIGSRSHCALIA